MFLLQKNNNQEMTNKKLILAQKPSRLMGVYLFSGIAQYYETHQTLIIV